MISVFRREADQNCALLGYYASSGGKFLPTFRDNLSVPFFYSWTLKMGPIGCPEKSVRHHHYSLRNNPKKCGSQLQHQFQTATVHVIQSLCLVLPCYVTAVRYNSRVLHRRNVTLRDPCLCSPQSTCSFISTPFMFATVLWHNTRLSTLSQKICSAVNKSCVNHQGHMALNESVYILLRRKFHVEAAWFGELVLCEEHRWQTNK